MQSLVNRRHQLLVQPTTATLFYPCILWVADNTNFPSSLSAATPVAPCKQTASASRTTYSSNLSLPVQPLISIRHQLPVQPIVATLVAPCSLWLTDGTRFPYNLQQQPQSPLAASRTPQVFPCSLWAADNTSTNFPCSLTAATLVVPSNLQQQP